MLKPKNASRQRRMLALENLENRQLMAADLCGLSELAEPVPGVYNRMPIFCAVFSIMIGLRQVPLPSTCVRIAAGVESFLGKHLDGLLFLALPSPVTVIR